MTDGWTDAEQSDRIDLRRRLARDRIADAGKALRTAEMAARELASAGIYDVEFVETSRAAIFDDALGQVRVGLAAMENSIPRPEDDA